jgi:hypothetical protein
MGTETATLLFAVPRYRASLGECNDLMVYLKEANLSGDREAVSPAKPGTRAVCVLLSAARGEFPASRGVLSIPYPE